MRVTCPECGTHMVRTPIYRDGRNVYRCANCGAKAVDDAQEPISAGKLIPLAAARLDVHE